MKRLAQLFERFGECTEARWWIGARPEGYGLEVVRLIAERVGYPTANHDPFGNGGMAELTRAEAAHVLAVAGTCSLAYGDPIPQQAATDEAAVAMRELGDDAVFFSNGKWRPELSIGWMALSAATFDCGVIGFDTEAGFIFWVEEED